MGRWLPPEQSITYGPILSRRLGWSLGINILPAGRKTCTFDCAYCYFGPTSPHDGDPPRWPDVADVRLAVAEGLCRYPHIAHITFAGNGEPTLHPHFHAIAEAVRRLRDELAPHAKLALFSNASTLERPRIREALAYFDLPLLKLDVGDEATFARLNRPTTAITLTQIIAALRHLPHPTIQSMLIDGTPSNVQEETLQAWLDALATVQPARVYLHTIDLPTAEADVRPVPHFRLRDIARQVQQRTGAEVWIA